MHDDSFYAIEIEFFPFFPPPDDVTPSVGNKATRYPPREAFKVMPQQSSALDGFFTGSSTLHPSGFVLKYFLKIPLTHQSNTRYNLTRLKSVRASVALREALEGI